MSSPGGGELGTVFINVAPKLSGDAKQIGQQLATAIAEGMKSAPTPSDTGVLGEAIAGKPIGTATRAAAQKAGREIGKALNEGIKTEQDQYGSRVAYPPEVMEQVRRDNAEREKAMADAAAKNRDRYRDDIQHQRDLADAAKQTSTEVTAATEKALTESVKQSTSRTKAIIDEIGPELGAALGTEVGKRIGDAVIKIPGVEGAVGVIEDVVPKITKAVDALQTLKSGDKLEGLQKTADLLRDIGQSGAGDALDKVATSTQKFGGTIAQLKGLGEAKGFLGQASEALVYVDAAQQLYQQGKDAEGWAQQHIPIVKTLDEQYGNTWLNKTLTRMGISVGQPPPTPPPPSTAEQVAAAGAPGRPGAPSAGALIGGPLIVPPGAPPFVPHAAAPAAPAAAPGAISTQTVGVTASAASISVGSASVSGVAMPSVDRGAPTAGRSGFKSWFQTGGPIGGGDGAVPIIAHAGEYVVNRNSALRNRPLLDAMNFGGSYQAGGVVAAVSGGGPGDTSPVGTLSDPVYVSPAAAGGGLPPTPGGAGGGMPGGMGDFSGQGKQLAQSLGAAGLSDVGFGDVFGKPPTQWGIFKTGMAALQYGMGMAKAFGGKGIPGMPTLGGMPGGMMSGAAGGGGAGPGAFGGITINQDNRAGVAVGTPNPSGQAQGIISGMMAGAGSSNTAMAGGAQGAPGG